MNPYKKIPYGISSYKTIRQENYYYVDNMIDQNVRIDYGKLRHLIVLDTHLNGNFSRLEHIIGTGGIASGIVESFPIEQVADPDNFVSLLFYFGLLSHTETDRLRIPNRTVS